MYWILVCYEWLMFSPGCCFCGQSVYSSRKVNAEHWVFAAEHFIYCSTLAVSMPKDWISCLRLVCLILKKLECVNPRLFPLKQIPQWLSLEHIVLILWTVPFHSRGCSGVTWIHTAALRNLCCFHRLDNSVLLTPLWQKRAQLDTLFTPCSLDHQSKQTLGSQLTCTRGFLRAS